MHLQGINVVGFGSSSDGGDGSSGYGSIWVSCCGGVSRGDCPWLITLDAFSFGLA